MICIYINIILYIYILFIYTIDSLCGLQRLHCDLTGIRGNYLKIAKHSRSLIFSNLPRSIVNAAWKPASMPVNV